MKRSKKLDTLTATRRAENGVSREDGLAAIRAYRRGVPSQDIANALGITRQNLYSTLGSWALRYAEVSK